MTNKQLQNILEKYPEECEILIHNIHDSYVIPDSISVEYYEDDNFEIPKIIIHTQ